MTQEEKLALAQSIRASNFIEPTFDPAYTRYLDLVDRREVLVPTSQGPARVFLLRPKGMQANSPILINIHGGGFVRPHMPCNTYFCAKMAVEAGCLVADIDYKLAPEYPYPVAFHECYDVVRWVFDQSKTWGGDHNQVTLCGHSAGGSLTLSIAIRARLTGDFVLRRQIIDFGAMDLVTDPAEKRGAEASVLSVERMRAFNTLYTDDDPKVLYSPYVSACCAPDELFLGLPETVILTAGKDPLRFEAEELAGRLVAQGVRVTLQRFLNSNHGFTVHCTGDWEAAQALILDTLRS